MNRATARLGVRISTHSQKQNAPEFGRVLIKGIEQVYCGFA